MTERTRLRNRQFSEIILDSSATACGTSPRSRNSPMAGLRKFSSATRRPGLTAIRPRKIARSSARSPCNSACRSKRSERRCCVTLKAAHQVRSGRHWTRSWSWRNEQPHRTARHDAGAVPALQRHRRHHWRRSRAARRKLDVRLRPPPRLDVRKNRTASSPKRFANLAGQTDPIRVRAPARMAAPPGAGAVCSIPAP